MIKSIITDLRNDKSVNLNTENNVTGLVVDTRPYNYFLNKVLYFSNNVYGNELAQDARPSGNTINVFNGLDNVYWTASTIVGNPSKFDFDSTIQFHTGTRSIRCTANNNDTFQLLNNTSLNSYDLSSFEGWIYIASAWTPNIDGLRVYLYNTTLGIVVSENDVNLANYINIGQTNSWQKFTIPITDFGSNVSFNAMRFTILENGTSDFYLDDFVFLEAGDINPIVYEVKPNVQTWLHVEKFTFTYADEYGTNLHNDIPYNGFFGINRLENGIVYQRVQENNVNLTLDIHEHIDLMHFGVVTHQHYGFDGTNSWVTVIAEAVAPLILKSEFEDKLRFIVSDNLSGLKTFKISVSCREENRCIRC